MIELVCFSGRQIDSEIKESIQIPGCIELTTVMIADRMLQLCHIDREYKCNSTIAEIMLNAFK